MDAVQRTSSSGTSVSSRAPPLTQTDAITSLLSLSLAAGAANLSSSSTKERSGTSNGHGSDSTSTAASIPSSHDSASTTPTAIPIAHPAAVPIAVPIAPNGNGKHHRRLGSTGQTRRRLSDAREATTRPILAATASSAALSLATLSLSTSPPSGHAHTRSLSQSMQTLGHGHPQSLGLGNASAPAYPYTKGYPYSGGAPSSLPNGSASVPISSAVSVSSEDTKVGSLSGGQPEGSEVGGNSGKSTPIAISTSANGKAKKRGVDYKCESCAKIYRHPNCLNKHRWEHTRQWREASKFVLSKHQQVQLLEAATILSFMGTASTSLPDDRSEWPSFVSGGSLPKVEPLVASGAATSTSPEYPPTPIPSSGLGHPHYAPQQSQAGVHSARATTYALHPHLVSSSVPNAPSGPRMHDYSLRAAGAPVKVTQVRPGLLGVPTHPSASAIGRESPAPLLTGESGGWSLPSSSLRSNSHMSRSRSRSRSRSGSGSRSEESLDPAVDIEGMDEEPDVSVASANSTLRGSYGGYATYPTAGIAHSPGYSVGYGYGHGYSSRRGANMKREDDDMSVGFSVREEDEEDADADMAKKRAKSDNKWDGMEMELDMDMD